MSNIYTAYRVAGHGPVKILLLHALTGGTDAADRDGVKGWWGPVFKPEAPLAEHSVTVWTPNLYGSCYGTTELDEQTLQAKKAPASLTAINTRLQAEVLADWIRSLDLHFDLLIGPSLGGMVGLELACLMPDRFRAIGIIGCSAKSDAWLWGTNEIQRAILRSPELSDEEAVALARRAAMLTFRTPTSLGKRFEIPEKMRAWLEYHGKALAARFTRKSYLAMLDAMDGHDLGRDRGGLVSAMSCIKIPLFVLGMQDDRMISTDSLYETIDSAKEAGVRCALDWIQTIHGHDSFLIEWPQVVKWLNKLIHEVS
ncbi:MAG: alpha/beta fold hydrolase [Holophagales bacterium]|jgi:homoserine O-acetyltransferase|nr:alpha/beta fold hydrolase [Holophagales bacterium]